MHTANALSPHNSVLIVGLGNPGARYAQTRHNIGYRIVNELAETTTFQPVPFSLHKRTGAFVAEMPAGSMGYGSPKIILARTGTPMNTSGALGTKDYARLSVGIGRPPGKMDPSSFVLGNFSAAQERELDFIIPDVADYLRKALL